MVWCGDCRCGWWCLAGERAKVEGWDLDQPLGSAWPVDKSLGTSSRWMGKLVVNNAAELLACPRKLRPL